LIRSDAPSVTAPPSDAASTAGRGGVAVLGAKVFFLVVGFVQQPLLLLAVGLGDFGGLAQATAVANVVNNVVTSSGMQGVSRVVAGAPGREQEALRAVLRVHLPLAVLTAAAAAAVVPAYARFERADDIVAPLLVMAGVALLYGLYAPLIGYLNGRNRFGRQAALDVTFATLRTIGLVGVGHAFASRGASGVLGITVGWLSAAACIVPLALRSTGTGRASAGPAEGVPGTGSYLKMLLPIVGSQLCTNLLMVVDTLLLGRFLSDRVQDAAATVELQRTAVKASLAVYRQCQTFAFLPYQLLFSITLVLFPMLARAHAQHDERAVREYVARGARLATIFCGLLVGVVVALPGSLLTFAYGAGAAQGADVLRVMALSQAAFAMLGIATTVLTSLGRERISAAVTLVAFLGVGAACASMVPGAEFGHVQLVRSAQATGVALVLALAGAAFLVRRQAGAFVPPVTAVRVSVALAACYGLGFVVPHVPRIVVPGLALAVACAYVGALVLTGELGQADLAMLRALRPKAAQKR
jgi:stage V sporulation protein B